MQIRSRSLQGKKWAFVSDYARFDLLYQYGGLYFDTDVEIIRSLDDIIEKGPFFGSERENLCSGEHETKLANTGLGFGAEKGMELYREILNTYQGKSFYKANGEIDLTTVVKTVSDILGKYPRQNLPGGLVQIQDVLIYPLEYFCPLDYETGVLTITDHTRSIHHYSATWKTVKEEKWHNIQQKVIRKFGKEKGKRIMNGILFRIIGTTYMYGFFGTVKRQIKKRIR